MRALFAPKLPQHHIGRLRKSACRATTIPPTSLCSFYRSGKGNLTILDQIARQISYRFEARTGSAAIRIGRFGVFVLSAAKDEKFGRWRDPIVSFW
jgi:hypothetical protein